MFLFSLSCRQHSLHLVLSRRYGVSSVHSLDTGLSLLAHCLARLSRVYPLPGTGVVFFIFQTSMLVFMVNGPVLPFRLESAGPALPYTSHRYGYPDAQ
jgi:hypothetical protein